MARLQEINQLYRATLGRHPPIDGEDGADGHIDINVGGAIQRIDQHHIFGALFRQGLEADKILFLFGGQATHLTASGQGRLEPFVGKPMQLLLFFALDIGLPHAAEEVADPGLIDLAIDDLGRQTNGSQQGAQLPGGMGKIRLLPNDKLAQGNPVEVLHTLAP